jgi:hypothetical protein
METSRSRRFVAALVLGMAGAPALLAQVDYRNLDDARPSRVTDAYPIERFAFELSVGGKLRTGTGVTQGQASPHLEYGILRNVMVGIGAELMDEGSHFEASAFWNARRETPGFPAVSVAASVGEDPLVRFLATRSFGLSRLHFNSGLDLSGPADWWGGLAWDRTLFRTSTLVVGEVVAERVGPGQGVEWSAGLGLRRQLTPTVVIHGGVNQGLGSSGTEFSLGLSHAFAIAGLMRGGRR